MIGISTQHGYGLIRLDHPPKNALTVEMFERLGLVLQQYISAKVGCIVIQGSPKAFCSGFDKAFLDELTNPDEATQLIARGQQLFNQIARSPIPVIAMIEGVCLGGGLELALACHLRYCSEKASFSFPEVGLGILPGLGGNQRLVQTIGYSKSVELVLTGKLFSASEAHAWGIVHEALPKDQLGAKVTHTAKQLAALDFKTVKACLQSLQAQSTMNFDKAMRQDQELTASLLSHRKE